MPITTMNFPDKARKDWLKKPKNFSRRPWKLKGSEMRIQSKLRRSLAKKVQKEMRAQKIRPNDILADLKSERRQYLKKTEQ